MEDAGHCRASCGAGAGHGGTLVSALEDMLRTKGAGILIADTSGTDDFAGTRAFYAAKGYVQEARIRDFWGQGDDKVVFWKSLSQENPITP